MSLYSTSNALICCTFPTTFRGSVRELYAHPKILSINSFTQLTKEFKLHFLNNVHLRPIMTMLLRLKQGEEEIVWNFVHRFTNEIRGIDNIHPSLIIQSFMMRLKLSHLFWLLVERTPTMMPEVLQKAN